MYIKTRTCNVYKHNELVMYILKWTRNVYNKILFIVYMYPQQKQRNVNLN